MEIPAAWRQIQFELIQGIVMVVGAPDSGKSTFARFLFEELSTDRPIAFLDGDPGQSVLGPPTTINLVLSQAGASRFPPKGDCWRRFVGSVSPSGHMLPLLVGTAISARVSLDAGAQVLIYDTTGLIDPRSGGVALKHAKVDLLRPSVIFALQREKELEPVLMPLRSSQRTRLHELPVSRAALRRGVQQRKDHRAAQFAAYFAGAQILDLSANRFPVFPVPRFAINRLVALEDTHGFTLGLGITVGIDRKNRRISLLTPLRDLVQVDAIRLGDVLVDPESYRDQRVHS